MLTIEYNGSDLDRYPGHNKQEWLVKRDNTVLAWFNVEYLDVTDRPVRVSFVREAGFAAGMYDESDPDRAKVELLGAGRLLPDDHIRLAIAYLMSTTDVRLAAGLLEAFL